MLVENYGIWIGANATVAIVEDYRISFLRVKEDVIISVLYHNDYGTVGVIYGNGINLDANATVSSINPETKNSFAGVFERNLVTHFSSFNNVDEAKIYLKSHSSDKIEHRGDNLIYTMYDGTIFNLTLSEKIEMSIFANKDEVDNTLSLTQKMAIWGIKKYFEFSDGHFNVGIETKRYSILFSFSLKYNWVYCRVGQNGYCEKGRAMLSTVCIRQNESRMIENNLLSMNEYKPIEDWFIVDGCSFPDDGGWYWSVKKVTNDIIYLNGCGDTTYEIHRK